MCGTHLVEIISEVEHKKTLRKFKSHQKNEINFLSYYIRLCQCNRYCWVGNSVWKTGSLTAIGKTSLVCITGWWWLSILFHRLKNQIKHVMNFDSFISNSNNALATTRRHTPKWINKVTRFSVLAIPFMHISTVSVYKMNLWAVSIVACRKMHITLAYWQSIWW